MPESIEAISNPLLAQLKFKPRDGDLNTKRIQIRELNEQIEQEREL